MGESDRLRVPIYEGLMKSPRLFGMPFHVAVIVTGFSIIFLAMMTVLISWFVAFGLTVGLWLHLRDRLQSAEELWWLPLTDFFEPADYSAVRQLR